ncbi:unnamed protein product [Musa banksii]
MTDETSRYVPSTIMGTWSWQCTIECQCTRLVPLPLSLLCFFVSQPSSNLADHPWSKEAGDVLYH